MFKRIRASFTMALANIRSRLFHTFLSVLGIVIGVAALVAILSLIDGMEKYANQQISQTTNLQSIFIRTETNRRVDNLSIRKDTFSYLNAEQLYRLAEEIPNIGKGRLTTDINREVKLIKSDSVIAIKYRGAAFINYEDTLLAAGHFYDRQAIVEKQAVLIANVGLAKKIVGEEEPASAIGQKIEIDSTLFEIIGVVKDRSPNDPATAVVPMSWMSEADLLASPPVGLLEVSTVALVPETKDKIETWLDGEFANGKEDFQLITNEFRVEQAAQGFLLFRIVMGLIVGISVLVGGIGVMNVLLISVTERTTEIGLRKALGATKKDIRRQFLAESITISVFGSGMGLVLGILGTLIIVPIIKAVAKMPFQAAFTLNTMLVIAVVAVVIGLIFGTYPATKAAQLDPVEAIRRE